MNNRVDQIREYAILGLNSNDPKHWSAALQDILTIVGNDDVVKTENKTYSVEYEQYASPTTVKAINMTDALVEALKVAGGKCDCCEEVLIVTSIKEVK